MEYLLTKGQSIKVFSMLLRKARDKDFVLPPPVRGSQAAEGGQTYEGGEVMAPLIGFYDQPVITLDFASLYPSIMQEHNLCYSTLYVRGENAPKVDAEDLEEVPMVGHRFVKSSKHRGLLPMVLEELLTARAAAKKAMKVEKDTLRKAVLDGRQLALKISANSVYGFTGMSAGILPCQAIAESVTAYGRQMIQRSKSAVEAAYGKNGEKKDFGATVIYGDTDSVMITLRKDIDLHASFEFGKEAAQLVSETFGKFIRMEFEKVYCPFLMMGKKRYAGLSWVDPDQSGKLDVKGVEVVRRDWCDLVRQVEEKCLDLMLRKGQEGVQQAEQLVKDTVQDLRQGKLDTRLLVLTKQLARDGDYKAKLPHATLCEKLKQRDPANAVRVGDRVQFIYIAKNGNAPAYERAEDPIYAMHHGQQPDADYYLEHQLKDPLVRLFKERLGEDEKVVVGRLFRGDHTRYVKRDNRQTGGLMKFIKVKAKCLGCSTVLTANNTAGRVHESEAILCLECASPGKAQGLALKQVRSMHCAEAEMASMMSQCASCEASVCHGLHKDCVNVDCPIFFRRFQVQDELKTHKSNFDRLRQMNLDW